MKNLKILYIEDDKDNREELIELLSDWEINDCKIIIEGEESFEIATRRICEDGFHMVILDLYKGRAGDGGEKLGLTTLRDVKSHIFVPIIFYSGNTAAVSNFKSQVVGVATKGDGGIDELKNEIGRLTSHSLPFIIENIYEFINHKIKEYFWGTIHENNTIFKPDDNDHSLGYLLLRNICNSLSRDNIYKIIGDGSIAEDKVHPMEFYIYPRNDDAEYENGDIIEHKESKEVYVILTPSCDFIQTGKRKRKAHMVLLAHTRLLTEEPNYIEYLKYKCKVGKSEADRKKEDTYKGKIIQLIESRGNDRYFFLPRTPFIENRVIDFQNKIMVVYDDLNLKFNRLAKLDDPYSQAMSTSYIRYYNRIGFPDLDAAYVLARIDD